MNSKPILKINFKDFQTWLKEGVCLFNHIDSEEEIKSSPQNDIFLDDDSVYIQLHEKYQQFILQEKSFLIIIDEMVGISFSTIQKTKDRKTQFSNLGETWLPFHYIDGLEEMEFSTWQFLSSEGKSPVEISPCRKKTLLTKDEDLVAENNQGQELSIVQEHVLEDKRSNGHEKLISKKEDTGEEKDGVSEKTTEGDESQQDEQKVDEEQLPPEKVSQEEKSEESINRSSIEDESHEDEQNNEEESLNPQEEIVEGLQNNEKDVSGDEDKNQEGNLNLGMKEPATHNKKEELDEDPDISRNEDKNSSESNPDKLFDTDKYERKNDE